MIDDRTTGRQRVSPRATTCFTCRTPGRSEWCGLDGEALEILNRAKVTNRYEPGQVIFYQGNPCLGLYCIEEGTVAVRRSNVQGASVITRLVHGGQTLGYRAFFGNEGYGGTATTLTPSRVCFIDRAAVRTLLERVPAVGDRFLSRMSDDLGRAEEERLASVALPLRARMARLLMALEDRFAEVDDQGIVALDLPLSRTDLAAMIGARPETVSRVIRQLEDAGVASFSGRTVRVRDVDLLLDEAEGPPG